MLPVISVDVLWVDCCWFWDGTPEAPVSVGDVLSVWRVSVQVCALLALLCFESVFLINALHKNSAACYAIQLSIKGVSKENHQRVVINGWMWLYLESSELAAALQKGEAIARTRCVCRLAKNRAYWLASKRRALEFGCNFSSHKQPLILNLSLTGTVCGHRAVATPSSVLLTDPRHSHGSNPNPNLWRPKVDCWEC